MEVLTKCNHLRQSALEKNPRHVLTRHVIVIVCGTAMWSAHGFVYINNEMIMICILPVRVKEQTLLGIWIMYLILKKYDLLGT